MAVPRARKTKSATGKRRASHFLKAAFFAKCKNCGSAVRPHEICANCGYYRGRQVIAPAIATPKKETR